MRLTLLVLTRRLALGCRLIRRKRLKRLLTRLLRRL